MEETKTEVMEDGQGVNGRLTIGVNTFSVNGLPAIFEKLQTQFQKITYKIQQNESSYLCQIVGDRIVELAIIRLLPLDDFSMLHLYDEPFYLITSKEPPLFDEEISLTDIQQYPLLFPSTEGLGVYYLILEVLGECSDISLLI